MGRGALVEPVDPMRYGPDAVLESLGPDGREIVPDATRRAVYEPSSADFFTGVSHFLCAAAGAELVLVGRMGADGYVGLPLFARDGKKLGPPALITSQPIDDVASPASSLMTVGTRASLELEFETAVERADTRAEQISGLLAAEDARLRRAVK